MLVQRHSHPRIQRVAVAALLAIAHVALAQHEPPQLPAGKTDTIDIRADDARLSDVLQQLADQTDRNIVIGAGVDGTRITVSIKGMTLTEVLDAILPGAGCGYRDRGNHILIDTLDTLRARETVPVERAVRVVRLKYTNAKTVIDMIQPFLGPGGKAVASPETQAGIETGGDTGGDSLAAQDVLIIEDTPDRLDELVRVIESIDVQPAQVLIEATILRSQLSDDNQLGVDLNFLGGVDFANVTATSTGGLNLEAGTVPTGQFDNGIAAVSTSFGPVSNNSVSGVTFGLIKNNVAVFVHALEQLTDTVVLANPKILALNKQKGQVVVGRRDGFLTTTVTQTTAVQTVEFLETGTQLTFRPFILDNNRVRMEIHVEDSSGGLTPSDLPFENTTESTSNILVDDGHTILIGGLFRNADDISRSQVPGLGEVPGLGALFRKTRDQTRREEVMVLLTVHVIKNDPRFNELGEQMLAETERIRIGFRERLQWFGRQKLAEIHLHTALQLLEAGRREQALYHTRLALAADPLISVGRRLRRQLITGATTIEPDNDIRQWVARRITHQPTIDATTGQPIQDVTLDDPTSMPIIEPSKPQPNDPSQPSDKTP